MFSDTKRANHADLSWRVRVIGSCAVFALAYLNWFLRHDDPDFEFTLGMSMVLAGIVAGHFFFVPWVLRGSRCFSWVDPFGIHWSRGLRCGGVQFRDAIDFTWREDSDIFILSVTRKDGGEPFEIAVPDATTRNKVSSILMTKGIRDGQGA